MQSSDVFPTFQTKVYVRIGNFVSVQLLTRPTSFSYTNNQNW